MISGPGPDVYTLAHYERVGGFPIRVCKQLIGAKRALFDAHVIWVSPAMLSLYHDRSSRREWRKFLRSVDVVVIDSLKDGWREAM